MKKRHLGTPRVALLFLGGRDQLPLRSRKDNSQLCEQFEATLSFREWSASLLRWIAQSRTRFAWLLCSTFKFSASRRGRPDFRDISLPLPHVGLFLAVSQSNLLCNGVLSVFGESYISLSRPWITFTRGSDHLSKVCFGGNRTRSRRGCTPASGRFLVACDSRTDRFPLPPGRSGQRVLPTSLILSVSREL